MNLDQYGWDGFFAAEFQQYSQAGLIPGRVFIEHKQLYRIYTEYGETLGEASGKFRHGVQRVHQYPAVGDWVAIQPLPGGERAIIHGVLPRKSKISRKVAWQETEEQILAANLDVVFIMASANRDFNLRRLERYLTLVWESGANPVVILSKADLCADIPEKLAAVDSMSFGVPAHAVSAYTRSGLNELAEYLSPGTTVAVLGSSGVGKSTLINYLAGSELLEAGSIRQADDRGRHTTTYRQLVCLPSGGMIIDTPGMRELSLWADEASVRETFEDIGALAGQCRFRDCSHHQEPGCAVRLAAESGRIEPGRLENFHKLQKELRYLEARQNQRTRLEEKQRGKAMAKTIKNMAQGKRIY
jgi:ribosome biogenesis GTPase